MLIMMQDVNNEGMLRLYGNSVLPAQVFCKPKTAVKMTF